MTCPFFFFLLIYGRSAALFAPLFPARLACALSAFRSPSSKSAFSFSSFFFSQVNSWDSIDKEHQRSLVLFSFPRNEERSGGKEVVVATSFFFFSRVNENESGFGASSFPRCGDRVCIFFSPFDTRDYSLSLFPSLCLSTYPPPLPLPFTVAHRKPLI